MKREKPEGSGRKKGTGNKITRDMREQLKTFLEKQRPEFEKAFKKLNPREKVRAYSRLLPFVTPAYQSISLELENMSEEQLLQFENYLKTKYKTNEQS